MAKRLDLNIPLEKLAPAALKAAARKRMSLRALIGKWENCNKSTRGIVRVELGASGTTLTVHVFGACTPTPCDWGVVRGLAYSENVSSADAVAFSANYKFSFKETIVTGHLNAGCLVVETYNHFTDGSGRCDYYSREIFCRH
jgi:hypothetical protein